MNPNILFYSGRSELDTDRKIFYCAEQMKPYVKGKVLDTGAGQGHLTKFFTYKNPNVKSVLCLEYSDYNRAFLKMAGLPNKKVNLDNPPYKIGKYDTIICTDVIEHLLSPYLFLSECFRLLNPNGYIILSTPDANKMVASIPHIGYFCPRGVELLLKRTGFKKIERFYNGIISEEFTQYTSEIPIVRNLVNTGSYFVAKKEV